MEARAIWKRIAPELHTQGRLSPLNADLLGIYCNLLAQAHKAEDFIEPGLLTKRRNGELVTNPAWRIYRDAVAQLRVLAADLGLTTPAG